MAKPSCPAEAAGNTDGLLAFQCEDPVESEGAPAAHAPAPTSKPPRGRGRTLRFLLGIAGVSMTAGVVAFYPAIPSLKRAMAADARPGQVTLDTRPPGADVFINGRRRGVAPLTIALEPGHHDLVLRRGLEERVVPLEIAAGAQVIQLVEFAATPVSATRLSVVTEPAGARVSIDGENRGFSPVTIDDLTAGRHRVLVTSLEGSAERTVTTEPGTTTSVVFSSLSRTPAIEAGWLTVAAAFEVKVMERDEVIGTSAASRIMIPAGHHELDLVNPGLGYRSHKSVDIAPGKIASVRIDARAPLNVNASPFAEVAIDGTPVGATPIADLMLPLGNHQVVFRHPDLGERRQEIVITLLGPNRVAADFAMK